MNLPDKQILNLQKFGTPYPSLMKRIAVNLFGNGYLNTYQSTEQFWTAIYSHHAASKRELVLNGYGQNVTVYSIITTISRVAAQAQWGVYRVKDARKYERLKALRKNDYSVFNDVEVRKTKEEALEPYDSHYLNHVFQHPNEQQSGSEFMENLLGFKLLTGDSYVWANMTDAGKIAEMWIMPSHHIEILTNGYAANPQREVGYKLQLGSRLIQFESDEICHSKYWNPMWNGAGSQLYGFSPLDAAWLNVMQDNNARSAAVELLQNRGVRGVLAMQSDKITTAAQFQENKGRLKEEWRQNSKEYRDNIMPIFADAKWVDIGLGAKDLAILEICNMNRDDLCNAYGISSILLNNNEHSTLDNYTNARKELITRAVLPLLNSTRDAFNRKLQIDWNRTGEKIVVDYDQTIYTELYDDVWKMVERMKNAGVFTDNEIRIQANYEALPAPVYNEVWKKTNDVPVSLINEKTLTRQTRSNEAV